MLGVCAQAVFRRCLCSKIILGSALPVGHTDLDTKKARLTADAHRDGNFSVCSLEKACTCTNSFDWR
jgi:hypothetical protein